MHYKSWWLLWCYLHGFWPWWEHLPVWDHVYLFWWLLSNVIDLLTSPRKSTCVINSSKQANIPVNTKDILELSGHWGPRSGTPLAASLLSTTHTLLLKREESPHSTQKKRCMQVDLSSDLGRFVFRNSFIYLKIFFLSVYLNFESLLNLVHYCFYFSHFLLIIFGCTGFLWLPVGIL